MISNQVFYNKFLLSALCAYLFNFLFSRSAFRFYSIYLIMCKIYVIKVFQYEKLRNSLKWRIETNCSWKRALCFNKRALLFDKEALGLSRRAGGGRILPNRKLFLHFGSNQEKVFFSKRTFCNKASDPRMLYLSKIGSGCSVFL